MVKQEAGHHGSSMMDVEYQAPTLHAWWACKMINTFVRSFMLCEALHAFGPTFDELNEDEEILDASTFDDYLKCKLGWLEGASGNFPCKQPVLKEPRTRVTSSWPAHGLLKMLGQEWQDAQLVGAPF
jgi:hypothetical protein